MSTDLVRRAQAGDHDAFAALAAGAIARLHRTARLILRDDERAGDAVQDALLQAWLDIRAVRDPERFEAWLNRVLVRSCYREADRSRRRRSVEVPVESIDPTHKIGVYLRKSRVEEFLSRDVIRAQVAESLEICAD